MDDLISRQAAIDAIMDEVEPFAIVEPGTTCVIGTGVNNNDVVRVLEQLPSAQPEIIRCKDCKYYDPNDHCYLQGAEADDFCSYAERRTDEQTD